MDTRDEYIYPAVETRLDYVKMTKYCRIEVVLTMRCTVRKKDKRDIYWKIKVYQQFRFRKDDEKLMVNILDAVHSFHRNVYLESKLSIPTPELIDLQGNSIYVIDENQESEKKRLRKNNG